MEFFGLTLFGSLTGGGLIAIAAVLFVIGLLMLLMTEQDIVRQ